MCANKYVTMKKLKKQAQSKADDEITASFDVSTEEGKKACLTSFKALIYDI